MPRMTTAWWRSFLAANWDLGFTAFGGPPVHFKIYYDRFVVKEKWIDEQYFQELFSVALALSGPASTKLLYCINLAHGGTLPAIISFFFFTYVSGPGSPPVSHRSHSLPAASAMFALSLGVANIDETLPDAAYAFLSGLNASVVGVIALATTELSKKAITDDLTRMVVFFTASAGMLYKAVWYFPTLLVISGVASLVHDLGLVRRLRPLKSKRPPTPESAPDHEASSDTGHNSPGLENGMVDTNSSTESPPPSTPSETTPLLSPQPIPTHPIPITPRTGLTIITLFLFTLLTLLTTRSLIPSPPRLLSLFTNMFLAGTIIFGGGPVVIPLLREYIVAQGWVSQRDFLIGLALIQAFPGPNFNIAVFLGSLTAKSVGGNPLLGAVLAWVGIFGPGMVLVHGTMGVWGVVRGRRGVRSVLRGVNAGAVGLIYTVVYRIWEGGLMDGGVGQGRSLGEDPWWLVVAATNYVFGRWYRVSPPVTIIAGALMGLLRYQVVSSV
ncbi:chromate transporter-domain-containing protein [Podospora aff. communis PSN243]|uniref:Chromate transporter-domain-containing protein n=1 Tax=Podospora aff. communis PSN243 TaxID=3040156 RepID=A0AAV9GHA9_9PEZI|nr:chromate transporter-domain-containing protein [Podospora aff. communis PSN243]